LEKLEKELEGEKEEDTENDAENRNNDPMVVYDNDSDDDDSSLGFKTHFEAEAPLEKAKVFSKQSAYPKYVTKKGLSALGRYFSA
jgi:hypothetical protein